MAYGAILGQKPPLPSIDETFEIGDTLTTLRKDLGENWVLADGRNISENDPIAQLYERGLFNPLGWKGFPSKGTLCINGDIFWISGANTTAELNKFSTTSKTIAKKSIPVETGNGGISYDYIDKKILHTFIKEREGHSPFLEYDTVVRKINPETLNIEEEVTTKISPTGSTYYEPQTFHVSDGYYIFTNYSSPDGVPYENEESFYFGKTLTGENWVVSPEYEPVGRNIFFYFQIDNDNIVFFIYDGYQPDAAYSGACWVLSKNNKAKRLVADLKLGSTQYPDIGICFDKETKTLYFYGPKSISLNLESYTKISENKDNLKSYPYIKKEADGIYFIWGSSLYKENPNGNILNLGSKENSIKIKDGYKDSLFSEVGRTIIDRETKEFVGVYINRGGQTALPVLSLPTITNPENVNTFIKIK